MKIKRMEIVNFKGIESFEFEPDDVCNIYGQNATGKTSIYDAYMWVISGKDSLGRADFDIKPKGVENPEVSVLIEFIDPEISFWKKLIEERDRAGNLKGHKTLYNVDGAEVKKKKYDERIEEIIGEYERFRLISDPLYFNSLHWEKRRSLLFSLVEGKTEIPEHIKSITGRLSVENCLVNLKKYRGELRKELDEIPARLEELSGKKKHENVPDLKALQAKLAELQSGFSANDERARLESELKQLRYQYESDIAQAESKESAKLNGLNLKIENLQNRMMNIASQIENNQSMQSQFETERQILIEKWKALNALTFSDDMATCPTCLRPFDTDKLDEAKRFFNLDKSKKLSEITSAGQAIRARMNDLESANAKLLAEYNHAKNDLSVVQAELNNLELGKEALIIQANFDLKSGILIKKIKAIPENIPSAEIERLQAGIHAVNVMIAENQVADLNLSRIAELKAQQKELSKKYDENEANISKLIDFIRLKCEKVTEVVNGKFGLVKWSLFEPLINGEIKDVCTCSINGNSDLSTAEGFHAGLDIIKTWQGHYGVFCPIWIDNRESIIEIPPMDCQIINLIVSERDKELRIN